MLGRFWAWTWDPRNNGEFMGGIHVPTTWMIHVEISSYLRKLQRLKKWEILDKDVIDHIYHGDLRMILWDITFILGNCLKIRTDCICDFNGVYSFGSVQKLGVPPTMPNLTHSSTCIFRPTLFSQPRLGETSIDHSLEACVEDACQNPNSVRATCQHQGKSGDRDFGRKNSPHGKSLGNRFFF